MPRSLLQTSQVATLEERREETGRHHEDPEAGRLHQVLGPVIGQRAEGGGHDVTRVT